MREKPKVLLIGDDVVRMVRLREILRRAARVVSVEDLPEALEQLARGEFETVFADWRFHCGTWREAVERLGALYPDLPVVVVSQTEGIEEGMQEWIEVVGAGAFDLLLSACNETAALMLLEHAVASGEARALRAAV